MSRPPHVDLAHSALLVVDAQNDFLAPGGAFSRRHTDTGQLAQTLALLVRAARTQGRTVAWISNWRVLLALHEKALAFESRRLRVMKEPRDTRSPEFLAINPRGQTPVLVEPVLSRGLVARSDLGDLIRSEAAELYIMRRHTALSHLRATTPRVPRHRSRGSARPPASPIRPPATTAAAARPAARRARSRHPGSSSRSARSARSSCAGVASSGTRQRCYDSACPPKEST